MKEQQSRRRSFMDAKDKGEPNPGEPLELPMGTHQPKSISNEIQQQIAIQIAKKQRGDEKQSPEQIFAELNDLEEPDNDPPWSSQYEYTDMHSEIMGDDLMDIAPTKKEQKALKKDKKKEKKQGEAKPPERAPVKNTSLSKERSD